MKAANLAIDHTEHFFSQIRRQIGDEEFSNFLNLKLTEDRLNSNQFCDGSQIKSF
jgi:hypothetical protein